MEKNQASPIKKIIFTGHIMRMYCSGVVDWAYHLLGPYVAKVSDLPVFCTVADYYSASCQENYIAFNVKDLYSFYDLDFNDDLTLEEKNQLWASIFYSSELNESACKYMNSIFKNSLVIAYEPEKWMTMIFEHFNIPYIEINLDPIRFYDDLLLSFSSNIREIYEEILKYRVNYDNIYAAANYIKTLNFEANNENSSENILLFLGQTSCDKTLIDNNNKIYSILEHKDDFKNAIRGFDKIFYKRHPMAYSDEEVLKYITSLKNVKVIDENYYKLLSRKNIKKVVAISSGGLIEARYFGKDVQYLLRESIPIQYQNEFDVNKYIQIYQKFFSYEFWSKILKPIIPVVEFSDNETFTYKNKLRNSRYKSMYYSYEDVEQEIVKNDLTALLNEKLIEQNKINTQLYEMISNMNSMISNMNSEIEVLKKRTFRRSIKNFFIFLRYFFTN